MSARVRTSRITSRAGREKHGLSTKRGWPKQHRRTERIERGRGQTKGLSRDDGRDVRPESEEEGREATKLSSPFRLSKSRRRDT